MKRFIVLAALACGCDDSQVSDKAAEILQYGAVRASVTCATAEINGACEDASPPNVRANMQRGADGSCIVRLFATGDNGLFNIGIIGRFESAAEDCSFSHGSNTWSVANGEMLVERAGCSANVYDLDTECSGYNLEAFD